jgi:hypothetical protein
MVRHPVATRRHTLTSTRDPGFARQFRDNTEIPHADKSATAQGCGMTSLGIRPPSFFFRPSSIPDPYLLILDGPTHSSHELS